MISLAWCLFRSPALLIIISLHAVVSDDVQFDADILCALYYRKVVNEPLYNWKCPFKPGPYGAMGPCSKYQWQGVGCTNGRVTGIGLGGYIVGCSIPSSLGLLTGLTVLALDNNSLQGSIPSELGGLKSLTFLGLQFNRLTGTIPSSLGGLTALTFLGLYGNLLRGPIPFSFCSFQSSIDMRTFSNSGLTCYPPCLSSYSDFMNNKGSSLAGLCRKVSSLASPSANSIGFDVGVHQFTVPLAKTGAQVLRIDACGAQGGNNGGDFGGLGGYISAIIPVTRGQLLYVYVGGAGDNGAFNGGGIGWDRMNGGGSSDIRTASGGSAGSGGMLSRVVVAGGGGSGCVASGDLAGTGGGGGGDTGGEGHDCCGYGGGGGTGTYGGASGADWCASDVGALWKGGGGCGRQGGAGGGGGWWGGGMGWTSGGGGSSYVAPAGTVLANVQGDRRCIGDGVIYLTPMSAPTPAPTFRPSSQPTAPTYRHTPRPTAPTFAPSPQPTPDPTAAPSPGPTSPTPAPTPSPTPLECPVGSYSQGETNCLLCPSGTTSPAGSASANACVNVVTNFSFAIVSVVLASFISVVYLYFGRYHRVAFVRRERVLLYQLQQFRHISQALSKLGVTLSGMRKKSREKAQGKEHTTSGSMQRTGRVWLFYAFASLLLLVYGAVSMFFETLRDFVDLLILFRGLRFYITLPYLAFLSDVLASLGPLVAFLFSPVEMALAALASIKIDLSAVKVTCPGASAPVNLLIDFFILGALIVVVGSDYQLFRSSVVKALMEQFSALVFSKEYKKYCMPIKPACSIKACAYCFPNACCRKCSTELTEGQLRHISDGPVKHMEWSTVKNWRFLLHTLFATLVSELLDFQLVLRFLMAQVHLNFYDIAVTALDKNNDCNNVAGLEQVDGYLAAICLGNAVLMLPPLLFEIGKFVVHGVKPSEVIIEANAAIAALEDEKARASSSRSSADAVRRFHLFDFLLWLPSVVAPDLWLAVLSDGLIKMLKTAVANENVQSKTVDPEKRLSVKSTWVDHDKSEMQVPPSVEAECVKSMCCGFWRNGPFLSVLAPKRPVVARQSHESRRFEEEPTYREVQRTYFEVGRSGSFVSDELSARWYTRYYAEENKRWRNSSRGHQLPSFHELIMLQCYYAVKINKVATICSIARQIAANFAVFVTSCLGFWTQHTQTFYGVSECVEIMTMDRSDNPHRRPREIVEKWKEYSEAWAAIVGPRAILFQLVPELTPLMTYTKIMATSPLMILDPDVPAPRLLDIKSFFRKARREVYSRPSPYPAQGEEDHDDLEWKVYLSAWHQYLTTSRLFQAIFNWCKLAFVFGLLASSLFPWLQFYVFTVQVCAYFLHGCANGIKGVAFLGDVFGLKDGDLPFTGQNKLRKRIDARCRISGDVGDDRYFANDHCANPVPSLNPMHTGRTSTGGEDEGTDIFYGNSPDNHSPDLDWRSSQAEMQAYRDSIPCALSPPASFSYPDGHGSGDPMQPRLSQEQLQQQHHPHQHHSHRDQHQPRQQEQHQHTVHPSPLTIARHPSGVRIVLARKTGGRGTLRVSGLAPPDPRTANL